MGSTPPGKIFKTSQYSSAFGGIIMMVQNTVDTFFNGTKEQAVKSSVVLAFQLIFFILFVYEHKGNSNYQVVSTQSIGSKRSSSSHSSKRSSSSHSSKRSSSSYSSKRSTSRSRHSSNSRHSTDTQRYSSGSNSKSNNSLYHSASSA